MRAGIGFDGEFSKKIVGWGWGAHTPHTHTHKHTHYGKPCKHNIHLQTNKQKQYKSYESENKSKNIPIQILNLAAYSVSIYLQTVHIKYYLARRFRIQDSNRKI